MSRCRKPASRWSSRRSPCSVKSGARHEPIHSPDIGIPPKTVLSDTSAQGMTNVCPGCLTESTGHGALRTTFSATLPIIM